jgi:hypothetical protein
MASKIILEQYNIKGEHAVFWLLAAQRLKRSGDIVFYAATQDIEKLFKGVSQDELENLHNLEIVGCAMLLYGLSIENLAKGLIVKATGKWMEGHDEKKLLKEASVILSSQEEDFVIRLTAFVEWAGRYPIPKSVEKICVPQIATSAPWVPLPFSTNERELYNKLFTRLESMY